MRTIIPENKRLEGGVIRPIIEIVRVPIPFPYSGYLTDNVLSDMKTQDRKEIPT
jgi:hypothetical protein